MQALKIGVSAYVNYENSSRASFHTEIHSFHAIYFDLKAACDKVDRALLVDKMKNLGIYSKTIERCRSYLSNRSLELELKVNYRPSSRHLGSASERSSLPITLHPVLIGYS